jgi:hypothetical protein
VSFVVVAVDRCLCRLLCLLYCTLHVLWCSLVFCALAQLSLLATLFWGSMSTDTVVPVLCGCYGM